MQPEKTLPRILIIGTLAVTIIYMLVNYTYFSAVSIERLAGVESIAHIVGTSLWGKTGGILISLLIAAGLVSSVSAMIITGPRVYEAMARDRLFPQGLAKLNQRGVPSRAVGFQAIVAIIFALTATFGTLLVYIGFTLNIFASLAVLALFRMRKQNLSIVRVCRGYPVTPIIFLLFTTWMTIWSIYSQPLSAVAGLGTLAGGYLIYLIQVWRKNRARQA